MLVFFYIDNPELGEQEPEVEGLLETWVAERSPHATYVQDKSTNTLGVQLQVKAPKQLNQPLSDMYAIAKKYSCDFVVGKIENEELEEVCFFGSEEGRPDAFEIGCYLGFE